MSNDLRTLLRLSFTPRWAVVPMLREQTVSDHSWRVAVIAYNLAFRALGWDYGQVCDVAVSALFHDGEEATTGDIPGNTKPVPDFAAMPATELVVKMADLIESATWAVMWVHPDHRWDVVRSMNVKFYGAMQEMEKRFPGSAQCIVSIGKELVGAAIDILTLPPES